MKYLDAVIKDHKIYLILEYAEGGSLASLIKRSVLSEALVKIYVKQILIGLKFLHEAGIIHRDIKGANILLTKESKIKISDFGIAVNPHGNQNTLSSAGTPFWMAPEAITGN